MATYRVLIKGNVGDARAAAKLRNIKLRRVRMDAGNGCTFGYAVCDDAEPLVRWLCEPGRAPYPAGTLLNFYSDNLGDNFGFDQGFLK